jgi:hypothetical protein
MVSARAPVNSASDQLSHTMPAPSGDGRPLAIDITTGSGAPQPPALGIALSGRESCREALG